MDCFELFGHKVQMHIFSIIVTFVIPCWCYFSKALTSTVKNVLIKKDNKQDHMEFCKLMFL